MRAIAEGSRFCETYFIVMDRLYEIMDKKLVQWGKAISRTTGIMAKLTDATGQKAKALLEERLVVAFDLCSAIKYLHGRKILYRDIKVS
jgi:serine/threonine protein kinase